MVDHPQVVVPQQQVGVAPGAVDVGGERVEPQDARADVRAGGLLAVVPERAGQEVDAEVEAGAGVEQVLDLLVGLVASDLRVELERHQTGRRAARAGWPAR